MPEAVKREGISVLEIWGGDEKEVWMSKRPNARGCRINGYYASGACCFKWDDDGIYLAMRQDGSCGSFETLEEGFYDDLDED